MRTQCYTSIVLLLFFFCLIPKNDSAIVRPPRTTTTPSPPYASSRPPVYTPVAKNSPAYQFMAPQNTARAAVGVPPLTWDTKLASHAQSWANQRKQDCALEHSVSPFGENIFWAGSLDAEPHEAAEDWISEKKDFNYGPLSMETFDKSGHYTQIVWRDSKRVGCAKATCDNNQGVFMICNYDPPGNYIGEKPY